MTAILNYPLLRRAYRSLKKENPDTWKSDSGNKRSLKEAIISACSCFNNAGKKHPHQYRLSKATLENQSNNLLSQQRLIKTAKDFDELHNIINQLRVHGVGDLTVYDISVRIGEFLGITPSKIYLHAGTRVGVEKLIGRQKSSFILKKDLPSELSASTLTCYELEDFLCIFKDKL